MNEFLKKVPFDLYELHLFGLVVTHRSFTKAAEMAGLTQSAITRQIQGMENVLGMELLERTTRSVRPTQAGAFLHRESVRLTGEVDRTLQQLQEEYAGARKQIRIGVSSTIGLAYLPGFFHATLRRSPQIACRVSNEPSKELLARLEANELDVGILCAPRQLPQTLRETHRFEDAFTLIAPKGATPAWGATKPSAKTRAAWMAKQSWLMITENSNTGQRLRSWMTQQGWRVEPTMQLDNFDLIISLVALGLGTSFVPVRALAPYRHKQNLEIVSLPVRFMREIVVIVRRNRKMPEHIQSFIQNILF